MIVRASILASAACFLTGVATAAAPDYDFQWATIGDPGNIPYPGGPEGQKAGIGVVDSTYRISRYEVTTAQWMEFLNAFASFPESQTGLSEPGIWGARRGFGGIPYALDPTVPNAAMVPIFGMTWRSAARYVNWLHNDKAVTLEALNTGVYDASTFGSSGPVFTDQLRHDLDAKFWIPTRDEWIKAAHYDPNRHGPGQAGWWQYSHRSDSPAVSGLPGVGQTTAGLPFDLMPSLIPLGAYPEVQSPWGLWDTSGGNWEWTEEVFFEDRPRSRGIDGSHAGLSSDVAALLDVAWNRASIDPSSQLPTLRVAGVVPSPTAAFTLITAFSLQLTIRQRRIQCNDKDISLASRCRY
jgi:hypothetical protein